MDTSDYLNALRRRLPMIAVVVVFAVLLAWITRPGPPPVPRYRATATLAVHNPGTRGNTAIQPINTAIVAGLATTGDVPAHVKTRIGFTGPASQLGGQIHAKADTSGGLVTLSTQQPGEKKASDMVSAFAAELVDYMQQRQDQQVQTATTELNTQLDQLKARAADLDAQAATAAKTDLEHIRADRANVTSQMNQLQQRIQQLAGLSGPGRGPVTQIGGVSTAPIPASFGPPSGPLARVAIAVVVGVVLGAGLVLVIDRVDPTLRSKRQTEVAFGFPVIAEVPELKGGNSAAAGDIVTVVAPRSAAAEAYRNLRTAAGVMAIVGREPYLEGNGQGPDGFDDSSAQHRTPNRFAPVAPDERRTVILVTSPGPGDGKTVCAVNLAASFAESGQQVILVGADMRRPALARYFGSSRQVDFNVGLGAASRVPDLLRPTRIPGLSVLPGGYQPNPAAVIPEQIERIAACRELADVVVVDTPPVLVANDAVELMRAADAVVLVARVGHTATGAAKQASELLHRLGMPVLGVVVLGSTSLPRAYLGYFEAGARVPSAGRRRGSTSASSAGQPRPVAPDGRRGSSRSRPRPGNSSRLLGEPPVGR